MYVCGVYVRTEDVRVFVYVCMCRCVCMYVCMYVHVFVCMCDIYVGSYEDPLNCNMHVLKSIARYIN